MFDEYLEMLTPEERDALRAVIEHVASVVPEATPGRSYGMSAFKYAGKPLLGFTASKKHLSIFPFSPEAIEQVKVRLAGYSLSKGTIRFTPDTPVPPDVLTDLVQARKREIDR